MRILLWLIYIVLDLVLIVVGMPLVAIAAYLRKFGVRWSTQYKDRVIQGWTWRWMWLWGNEEDGVTGPVWYFERTPTWSSFKRTFMWSAVRNPVNNLRFVPLLNPLVVAAKVNYRGNTRDVNEAGKLLPDRFWWSYTWQDIYSGLRVSYKGWALYLGYKITPQDQFLPNHEHLTGFAIRLRRLS
jgi:hypothetical protein